MKTNNKLWIAGALVSGLVLVTMFNNCSKRAIESVDEQAKFEKLSGESLFGEETSATESGSSESQTSGSSCDPNIDDTCSLDDNKPPVTTSTQPAPQPDQPAPPAPTPPQNVPVERHCTTQNGPEEARVVNSSSLKFEIYTTQEAAKPSLFGGNTKLATICTDTDTTAIKKDLKSGVIDISRCMKNANGKTLAPTDKVSFALRSFAVDGKTNSQGISLVKTGSSSLISALNGQEQARMGNYAFSVYYADNPSKLDSDGGNALPADRNECDSKQSPLFIDMRDMYEKTEKFNLLAPWSGVKFDIMGENAQEKAHEKYQISWFKRGSGFGYIALPNEKGEVLGIDQLFGNNTKGPDGKFATNGYTALAKYDDNKDGLITEDDAVFSKLRVWMDHDSDGRSSQRELIPLKEVGRDGLVLIDLKYDGSFKEKDLYNNTIAYKSVAKTGSGDLKLVFDVWYETDMQKSRDFYSKELKKKLQQRK